MNKIFKKIIISALVAVIFLAPFSGSLKLNTVSAAETATANVSGNSVMINVTGISLTAPGTVQFYLMSNTSGQFPANLNTTINIPKTDTTASYAFTGLAADTYTTNIKINNIPISSSPVFTIVASTSTTTPTTPATPGTPPDLTQGSSFFDCSWTDLPCGLTKVLYLLIFSPISYLAHLAATVMDFFIYYSINGSSYASTFVGTAWGTVRDIANIFFIIALLYIAISTILDLGHSHSKKMIINVILAALLINFSLFFTQVLIDGTNILAHVFYNNIQVQTISSTIINPDPSGSISISTGLVAGFDPQQIFMSSHIQSMSDNLSLFALITIIMTVICAYMIYMFLSISLLFVGRVAGLWIAMVFAPIAFASFTLPFNIPGIGHKDWWDDLWKQAFMAPMFIFFLYVIFLFIKGLNGIVADFNTAGGAAFSTQGFDAFMKVIIPMMIIFILLMKSKELAISYSGKMGEMFNKIGGSVFSAAGGAVAGAALGGTAILGRATLGRLGESIAKNQSLAKAEERGVVGSRLLRNIGTGMSGGSMDLRGVRVAGYGVGSTGLNVGEARAGGFAKIRSDKLKKRMDRAEQLKQVQVGGDSKLKIKLDNEKGTLQQLKIAVGPKLEKIDHELKDSRENLKDASAMPKGAERDTLVAKFSNQISVLKNAKSQLKVDSGLKAAEGAVHHTEQDIQKAENATAEQYAKTLSSGTNKFLNAITSFGQHSTEGADEAARMLRANLKAPTGGHSDSSHGTPPPKGMPKSAPPKDDHGGGEHKDEGAAHEEHH